MMNHTVPIVIVQCGYFSSLLLKQQCRNEKFVGCSKIKEQKNETLNSILKSPNQSDHTAPFMFMFNMVFYFNRSTRKTARCMLLMVGACFSADNRQDTLDRQGSKKIYFVFYNL